MKSGRFLTWSVVKDERWFGGEGEHWAVACPVVEGEGDVVLRPSDLKVRHARSYLCGVGPLMTWSVFLKYW